LIFPSMMQRGIFKGTGYQVLVTGYGACKVALGSSPMTDNNL